MNEHISAARAELLDVIRRVPDLIGELDTLEAAPSFTDFAYASDLLDELDRSVRGARTRLVAFGSPDGDVVSDDDLRGTIERAASLAQDVMRLERELAEARRMHSEASGAFIEREREVDRLRSQVTHLTAELEAERARAELEFEIGAVVLDAIRYETPLYDSNGRPSVIVPVRKRILDAITSVARFRKGGLRV